MSKKKFAIILGAIAVAAVAAAVIWYFFGDWGRDSNDRVYVEKVSVIMGTTTGAQNRYSGVVQPQKTVEVNADSERTVKEVLVKVGDEVAEGTALFNYDTDDLNMDLEQAKLELENQDIEISNYKSQITELEKEKKEAAEEDKFEYTTQIQTIETQIKQAEFEKSSKQLEIDKLQKKIDNSQVISTAAGVVKSINDGQSQDMGDGSSAFMTILSTGEYRIQGTVNEQNIGMITAGADVIVRSRVDEEITWKGTIDSIDTGEPSSSSGNQMDMGESEDSSTISSNYPFYVTLEDAEGLMLGQHVLIELDEGQMEEKEGVWLYSSYIVFEDGEGKADEDFESLMGDTEYEEAEDWTENEAGEDFESQPENTDEAENAIEDGAGRTLENLTENTKGGDLAGLSQDVENGDLAGLSKDAENGDLAGLSKDAGNGDLAGLSKDAENGDLAGLSQSAASEEFESLMDNTETEQPVREAFVWADDGNGRLEKRAVELGAYDAALDEYQILSGLTEDDLIAWPMEGLYEGIITVRDIDEVDYTSGLYNQDTGTEEMWYDSEEMWNDTEWLMDDGMLMEDESYNEEMYQEDMQDTEVSE